MTNLGVESHKILSFFSSLGSLVVPIVLSVITLAGIVTAVSCGLGLRVEQFFVRRCREADSDSEFDSYSYSDSSGTFSVSSCDSDGYSHSHDDRPSSGD